MSLRSNVKAFGFAVTFIVLLPLLGSYTLWELNDKGIIVDELIVGSITIVDLIAYWSIGCVLIGVVLLFIIR